MGDIINIVFFVYSVSFIITAITYSTILVIKKCNKKISPCLNYSILKINLMFYFVPIIIYLFNKNSKIVNDLTYNVKFLNSVNRAASRNNVSIVLFAIWIIGSLVYIIYNIHSYFKLVNMINKYSVEITDKSYLRIFSENKKRLGINKKVNIKENTIIKTPFVMGLHNKVVVIPSDLSNSSCTESILCHELIHLKRGDLFIKKIQLFVKVIFWFNPFVYILDTLLDDWCEISCDKIVCENLSHEKRKEYGYLILDIMKGIGSTQKFKFSRGFCSEKSYIKTRLGVVIDSKKDTSLQKLLRSVSLAFTIIFCMIISIFVNSASIFSSRYKVVNDGCVYTREFKGGTIDFNKDTGNVNIYFSGDDIDEAEYNSIISNIYNEGEIE